MKWLGGERSSGSWWRGGGVFGVSLTVRRRSWCREEACGHIRRLWHVDVVSCWSSEKEHLVEAELG